MKSKFEQLRALLTQKEWDNFLANLNLPESYFVCVPLDEILSSAFGWKYSPQGHDYWEAIRERVCNNLPVPETLQTVPESTPQAEIQPKDKQEIKMNTANSIKVNLTWSLTAICPTCKSTSNLANQDDDGYIARNIFNNSWGNLVGYKITCPSCASELKIKRVEY